MHCSRYRESGQGVLTAPTAHSDLTPKKFGLLSIVTKVPYTVFHDDKNYDMHCYLVYCRY
jgi:hypothetical protein